MSKFNRQIMYGASCAETNRKILGIEEAVMSYLRIARRVVEGKPVRDDRTAHISSGFFDAAAPCADETGESQTTGSDAPSASDDDDDGGDDDGEPARRPLPYPPALFSFESLSAYTQLNRTRVYSLIRQGKFPRPLKFGKTSRWRKSDVDAWIAAEAAVQLEG